MNIEATCVVVFTDNDEKYKGIVPDIFIYDRFNDVVFGNIIKREALLKLRNINCITAVIIDFKDDKHLQLCAPSDNVKILNMKDIEINSIKIHDKVWEFAQKMKEHVK
jgi:hypothetical protein